MKIQINKLAKCIMVFIVIIQQPACKHNHSVSESLKQAYEVQKEALQIASEVDNLAKSITDENMKSNLIKAKDEWMKQKISIEALEPHDHSKCSHDHRKSELHISDADMIIVQKEWKDSILSIKNKIVNVASN